MAKKEKNYILFSPLGDTDPIRGCYDGACLHIIRHYRPKVVSLFFTKDMAEKERHDQRYTRAIRKFDAALPIEYTFTDIEDPQNYDCFNQAFPKMVRELHHKYNQAQILLNLSSGTPQMKTVLAILATENDWCTGVQVSSPERGSNRKNTATRDDEDIDALLENNFDDLGAENRCSEPPLHVIRFFREKNQILSLIRKYEYKGAYEISNASSNISKGIKLLLRHADLRSSLLFDEAERVLPRWQGKVLLVKDRNQRALLEYYYLMKIDQYKGRLPEMMVKISPFLFEYLLTYVQYNDKKGFLQRCCRQDRGKYIVQPDQMDKDLLDFFNHAFSGKFRGGDLSFRYLSLYCQYMTRQKLGKDFEMHCQLMALNVMSRAHINKLGNLRNEAAHTIVDINEKKFVERTGLSSQAVITEFGEMLNILYNQSAVNKSIYDQINEWIYMELQKGCQAVEESDTRFVES